MKFEYPKARIRSLSFILVLILMIGLIGACDALTPVPPTLTPTWAFSAPTLAATEVIRIVSPTPYPPDYNAPGQNSAVAAGLPAQGELPPIESGTGNLALGMRNVQIPLLDGVLLDGDLYENPPTQTEQGLVSPRLPGILILGGARDTWGTFPAALRDAGFTVLVMDMGSRTSTQDFVSVMGTFSETLTVDPGYIGVIGGGQGADLALLGCAVELLCDTVALLSPIGQTTLVNVMANYNPRSILLAASSEDTIAMDSAQAIQAVASGEASFQTLENAGRGAAMLTNAPQLSGVLVEWFTRYLVG